MVHWLKYRNFNEIVKIRGASKHASRTSLLVGLGIEAKCETFAVKMSFSCTRIRGLRKLRNVLLDDVFCNYSFFLSFFLSFLIYLFIYLLRYIADINKLGFGHWELATGHWAFGHTEQCNDLLEWPPTPKATLNQLYICCAFMLSVPFFIVFSWYFSVFSLNKSVYKTLTDNWKKKSADWR